MNINIYLEVYGAIILVLAIVILVRYNQTKGISLQTFSSKKDKESSKAERDFLLFQLKRYSNQQYWAFALLWVAISISLTLGGTLIYKNYILHDSDFDSFKHILGLAGGTAVSAASFRFYRATSRKLETLLEKLR